MPLMRLESFTVRGFQCSFLSNSTKATSGMFSGQTPIAVFFN